MTQDDDLPEPEITPPRRTRGLSAAWLVPLLALAIAGGVAWTHYRSLGPTIRIVLEEGAGIEAGRTEIRYRDVTVGLVEELSLSDGLDRVEAVARLEPGIADALREDTTFWVVRPQVSASGISGLETLVSGAYLGVDWGEGAPVADGAFNALPAPPRTPPGTPGRRVQLVSPGGAALGAAAPVFYKSIEVGQIEDKRLDADGERLVFDAFIRAPYHERLGPGTRFWDSSGIGLSLGADGVSLDVGALATILQGGVVFDTVIEAPSPREAGAPWRLHASRKEARESTYAEDPVAALRFTARFQGSVRGLSVGAPVEIRGVTVGEVEELQVEAGRSIEDVSVLATLRVQPGRLGLTARDRAEALAFFERSVAQGLRAQLAAGNLLTGALYVELGELDEAPRAALDTGAEPHPLIPSAPSDLERLRGSAQELLARLTALPLEETVGALNGVLANLEGLTGDPALRRLPAEAVATVESAGAIVEELRAAGLGERIGTAAGDAGEAAAALSRATDALPRLVERLDALAAKTSEVVAAYGPGATLNTEAVTMLRDMRQAARAVSSLAQALERRPNSLIIGR